MNLGLEMADQFDGRDATKLAEEIRFLGIPPSLLATLPGETKTANLLPLRTPYAGVVVASDVVAGEVVDATKLLFTVADPRSLWLLAERAAGGCALRRARTSGRISHGQRLRGRPRDGLLAEPDGRRARRGRCACASCWAIRTCGCATRRSARRGSFCGANRTQSSSGREAVQSTAGSQFVFVRDKDYLKAGRPKVFHVRQVRTGARDDEYVELLAGVLPGEVVATTGSAALLAQLLRSSLGEGCGCGK